ncbi:NUDIX domain-containing protein [Dermatophilaceae bacterium Sec6.4]
MPADPSGQEPTRTLRAVPPQQRPLRTRRTARVLLIDRAERVLLFSDRDPGVSGVTWWITPGGGIEAGESDVVAAIREVHEETGLLLDATALIGPLAARRVRHGYSDVVINQHDTFFAAYVDAFEVDTSGHTQEEKITMTASRWWSRDELATTTATIWPAQLGQLRDAAGEFEDSARTMAQLPDADESTVSPDLGWAR